MALKKVREEFGLTNVYAMLPFVRTTWELKKVKRNNGGRRISSR